MTRRYALTAAQWRKIEALVPGKAGDHGRTVSDHRLFVNSVMWVRRSGAHWKHLPEQYGHGKSVPIELQLSWFTLSSHEMETTTAYPFAA
jgi:transposase